MYSEDVDDDGTASTSTPPSLLIDRLWKTNVVAWGNSSGIDSRTDTPVEESISQPLRQGEEVLVRLIAVVGVVRMTLTAVYISTATLRSASFVKSFQSYVN